MSMYGCVSVYVIYIDVKEASLFLSGKAKRQELVPVLLLIFIKV